jgi:hypothetical protein
MEKNRSHTKKGPGRMPFHRAPRASDAERRSRSHLPGQPNFKRES